MAKTGKIERENGRCQAVPAVGEPRCRFETILRRTLDVIGILVCLAGIWASVRGNFAGRSLYVDEASVVYSIETRTLWNLVAEPLPFHQTAPVLWLWLVKLITMTFGSSEVVLRSLAVASYVVALVLTAWSARRFFGVRCPWMASACLANMLAFLRYSNVVKPYAFEAVCVLSVLVAYGFRREGKLSWWGTCGIWLVAMAGGNPAVFFVAACLLHEMLGILAAKDFRRARRLAVPVLGMGGVFLCYYAWWLQGVANSEFMQDWWRGHMMSLWPPTWSTFLRNWQVLMGCFFKPTFGERAYAIVWLFAGGLTMAWTGKARLRRVAATGLLLALFASGARLFPMDLRLWIFSLPVFAIVMVGLTTDLQKGRAALPMAVLTLGLVLGQFGIPRYFDRNNIYWTSEELNPLLDYIQMHVAEDESVYVTDRAIPGVKYHFGYDFERFGKGKRGNVIWGSDTWERTSNVGEDAGRIEEAGKCWLVLIPEVYSKTHGLWERLRQSGTVKEVYRFQGTPLYYYERGE